MKQNSLRPSKRKHAGNDLYIRFGGIGLQRIHIIKIWRIRSLEDTIDIILKIVLLKAVQLMGGHRILNYFEGCYLSRVYEIMRGKNPANRIIGPIEDMKRRYRIHRTDDQLRERGNGIKRSVRVGSGNQDFVGINIYCISFLLRKRIDNRQALKIRKYDAIAFLANDDEVGIGQHGGFAVTINRNKL